MNRAQEWLKQLTLHYPFRRTRAGDSQPAKVTLLGVCISETERCHISEVATSKGWEQIFTTSCAEAEELLAKHRFAIVFCDRDLKGTDWRTAMERLAKAAPASCIFLLSAVNDEYLWQEVVLRGGFDVITKPVQHDHLRRRIEHAWFFWKTGVARHAAIRE